MGIDLFSTQTSSFNLYNQSEVLVGEVDLRKELYKIIYTEGRGTDVIYRRVQLENNYPKKCICTKNNRSREVSRDIRCDKCDGMGYFYNDILTKCYVNHSQAYSIYEKTKPEGDSQAEPRTIYFEWNFIKEAIDDGYNIPIRQDRIIELEKDLAGNILSPTRAREVYEILSVDPYRLDNKGRIEYYRCRVNSVIDKSFLV